MSYKIVLKILVERLRPLFNKLISPYQVAWVLKRWIYENFILEQEILDTMRKKQGRSALMK